MNATNVGCVSMPFVYVETCVRGLGLNEIDLPFGVYIGSLFFFDSGSPSRELVIACLIRPGTAETSYMTRAAYTAMLLECYYRTRMQAPNQIPNIM